MHREINEQALGHRAGDANFEFLFFVRVCFSLEL